MKILAPKRLTANNPIYLAMEKAFQAVGVKPTRDETCKAMMDYCRKHLPNFKAMFPYSDKEGPGVNSAPSAYLRSIGVKFDEDKPTPFINPFTKVQSGMKTPELLIDPTPIPAKVQAAADESVSNEALNHLQGQLKRIHSMLKPGISKSSAVAASKALATAIDALTFQ